MNTLSKLQGSSVFFEHSKFIVYPIVTLVGVIALEHITKILKIRQPSSYLNSLVPYFTRFWKQVGKWAGVVSSFYTYLHFDELLESAGDIVVPLTKMVISPVYSLVGYAEYVRSYIAKQRWMVIAGTMTLAASVGCALYYFGLTSPSRILHA